jgi:hypothetical protein
MSIHSDDTLTLNGGKLIELTHEISLIDSEGILQKTKNVYHFYRLTAFAYIPADIAGSFLGGIGSSVMSCLSSSVTSTLATVRDISNPASAGFEQDDGTPGANGGDRLPSSQAVVINTKTGARGKNYRGSKHYVGCSESFTTRDELNASATPSFNSLAGILGTAPQFNDSAGNQWNLCVLSTSLSKLSLAPVVVTYADVTLATVNLTLGTMRRRKEITRVL